MSGTPRDDQDAGLSERLLDKEENESDSGTLEEKARLQTEKLSQDSAQDNLLTDNQNKSDRILDKEDTGE